MNKKRPDSFRHTLDFYNEVLFPDGYGGSVAEWVKFVNSLWCNVEFLKGSELVQANQKMSARPVEVQIRYNPLLPLTEASKIIYKDWLISIHSLVDIDERQHIFSIIGVAEKLDSSIFAPSDMYRLLEDGTVRYTEDGTPRRLEAYVLQLPTVPDPVNSSFDYNLDLIFS